MTSPPPPLRMFRPLCAVATTWPFIGSLLVLIANDAWFKFACPGFVSGKLSDLAGMAIVSLLLLAAHPNRRWWACGAIVLGFAWWKSPLSQPVIDAVNRQLPVTIGRTVDYTDLIAFLVMPLCAAVAARPMAFAVPHRVVRRLMLPPVAVLTTLGLMATSVMPTRQGYQIRGTEHAVEFDRPAIAETIAQVAANHGLACDDCANRAERARYKGNGVVLRYAFSGPKGISFEVEALPNGIFLGTSGQEKADRLRHDLKSRLSSSHRELEYVEPLKPRESQ